MNYLIDLAATLQKLDVITLDKLQSFITHTQGTVWIAGNGGSASVAQHWACDLSKAAERRVQALGSNLAVMTAWANDVSYEDALAEELKRLAQPGDSVICLSCSGASKNIWTLLRAAERLGLKWAMVTSDLPPTRTGDPLIVRVPHTHYGILEDCFMAIGHWLTEQLRPDATMPRRVDGAPVLVMPVARKIAIMGDAE